MTINNIADGIMIIIPSAGIFRFIILAISLMLNQEEEKSTKKKMCNTLIFVAISASAGVLKDIILSYFR